MRLFNTIYLDENNLKKYKFGCNCTRYGKHDKLDLINNLQIDKMMHLTRSHSKMVDCEQQIRFDHLQITITHRR